MEAEELYEEEQMLFGGPHSSSDRQIWLNQLLMQRWSEQLNQDSVFGWIPNDNPNNINNIIGQPTFATNPLPSSVANS